MRRYTLLFLAAVILTAFTGCSSLPGRGTQEPVSKTRAKAAEYAQSGNDYLNKGNFEMAVNFFEMARDLNLSVDNQVGVAESYNSLGKVYLAAREYDRAENNFASAHRIALALNNDNLMGRTLGLQGELALTQGAPQVGLSLFEEGLALLEKGSPDRAILLHNQASALKRMERYEEAVEALSEAVSINEKTSQYSELGANHYLLAALYSKQEIYPLALEHAAKALENDKIVENRLGIAQDLFAFGRIHQKTGEWQLSHDYFLRAFLVYETMGIRSKMLETLPYLEQSAEALGDESKRDLYRRTRETLENKS